MCSTPSQHKLFPLSTLLRPSFPLPTLLHPAQPRQILDSCRSSENCVAGTSDSCWKKTWKIPVSWSRHVGWGIEMTCGKLYFAATVSKKGPLYVVLMSLSNPVSPNEHWSMNAERGESRTYHLDKRITVRDCAPSVRFRECSNWTYGNQLNKVCWDNKSDIKDMYRANR